MKLTWRGGPYHGQQLDSDILKAQGRLVRQNMQDFVDYPVLCRIIDGTDGGGPYILWPTDEAQK